MDVVVWLRGLGLGEYEAAFRKNEIDETVLPILTAEDLKELGVIALGHPPQTAGRDCGSPKRYKRSGVSR
jgi:SAM domain (Sterile alpha motif)